jgi:DNA-binding MarR family transcriptional regulator
MKLPNTRVITMIYLWRAGYQQKVIAGLFDVTPSRVHQILEREAYRSGCSMAELRAGRSLTGPPA